MVPEREAFLGVMPVHLPESGALASKLVSVFPGNEARGLPSHNALIAVFDPETGAPLALMEGAYITAMRTAAGSALATRMLARADASLLAVVGTGVQARSHGIVVSRVRPVKEVRIAGRSIQKARALAEGLRQVLGLPVEATGSYREALADADIVCTTTHAAEPVVRWEWLKPGAHVNSVGLNPQGREVDEDTVASSLVVVESRQSALAPPPAGANDLLWPIRDGRIAEDHIHAEIGELVAGSRPGRTEADQVTLYKSVGVAVQDAVAAALVLDEARRRGVGVELDL